MNEGSPLDKALEKFSEDEGVYYELSAKNRDGETLVKFTSHLEAKDAASYADSIDEKILEMAITATEEDYDEN